MKVPTFGIAVAVAVEAVAAGYVAPRNDTPALSVRDAAVRGRNLILEARQSYDYCDYSSTYYCINSNCCGTTLYNCIPPGAECCASLSSYGYGLWCDAGTTCTVVSGYVRCKDSNGDTVSAVSSATGVPTATGTSSGSGSGSSYSSRKKKKGKPWIAAVVIIPLLGLAIFAGAIFFLCVVKKKKNANNANATAAIVANQQNGSPPVTQPPMATAPPPGPGFPAPGPGFPPQQQQMGAPAPMMPNPDTKTPAYTYAQDVPQPIASPPPQWTPASPAPPPAVSPIPTSATPVPIHPPVSPINTGNATPYTPQPVYGNAMELPTTQHTAQGAPAPRGGAHEMGS